MSILADRHDGVTTMVAAQEGQMDGRRAPPRTRRPTTLGGMARGFAVRHPDDVVQVVYGEDGHYLSVFEQAGELEDGRHGRRPRSAVEVSGVEAWRAESGGGDRAPPRGGLRPDGRHADTEDLDELVDDLPDARPLGLGRRIGDAMDDLVDAFGLG